MVQLKMDEDGHAVVEDGKPVLVYDDGREAPLDFSSLIQKVKTVSDERDAYKTKFGEAESRLSNLGASEEEIAKALEVTKALDSKKLVDAGKVDEAVAERVNAATKAWEQEKAKFEQSISERDQQLDNLMISQQFRSGSVEKVLEDYYLTPSAVEALFGRNFKREGNEVVPYKADGTSKIFSRENPGEVADIAEALSELLESHPDSPKWRRGSGATGSDAPGAGSDVGGVKQISRERFEAMPPQEQMDFTKDGGKIAA